MARIVRTLSICAAAAALGSCDLFQHDVAIGLEPDPFVISTSPDSLTGVTNPPLSVDPASAGADYVNNKSKIDSATLKSLKFEIVSLFPDNGATQLVNGTVKLTDKVTGESVTVNLVTPIAVQPSFHDLTELKPDPSPLIAKVLKAGHAFTAEATATIDKAPVHLTAKVHFAINLRINLL
jgi:hypothetical protein